MIKVASYCRVSTDSEDQANSFESQRRFFREYIERHSDWELYAVYADEGVTGTSTKKRTQFNKMISDAYNGRFNLIITKEVSRFSRNLLDTIAYTRELKSIGIGVIFMNDGFASTDPDAELRLSIMGSLAQEESRKTSARVKWGQTRQMERGVVFGNSMLGYDVRNGNISINPEGAEIVKLIFQKYAIEQKGTSAIAHELQKAGLRTRNGNTSWSDSSIVRILRNEKYAGDLIQKKTITPNFLTHEKKKNKGEEDLIIIRNHHTPIIDRELWNLTQEELVRRNRNNNESSGHSNRYVFSGKMICAECGARFISRCKTRKNGTAYRRWGCYSVSNAGNTPAGEKGSGCHIGKQIRDEVVMEMLTKILNCLPIDYSWIIQNLTTIVASVILAEDDTADDTVRLQRKIHHLMKKKEASIDAYVSGYISAEELGHMRDLYEKKIEPLQKRLSESRLLIKPAPEQIRSGIEEQIRAIVECSIYAEPYYRALLQNVMVHRDGQLDVRLNHLPHIWIYHLDYHKSCQRT